MSIEIGNLEPLRTLEAGLAEWHQKVSSRPHPENDPVAQTLAILLGQLREAIQDAGNVQLELYADQYAKLRGMNLQTLYKRWQRGKLPEAHMRGGKLVVPISALMDNAA